MALLVTAIAVTAAILLTEAELGVEKSFRWGGLAATSALLFWVLLSDLGNDSKSPRFWAFVAAFAALHFTAWVVILKSVPDWRLMWFLAAIVEVPIFNLAFGLLFPIRPDCVNERQ